MTAQYAPDLYDAFHDDAAADARFYLSRAQATGGPVLELGVGTGRTLLPIARAGIEIHGLDLDDGMLARLRTKLAAEPADVQARVQVHVADMQTFSLPTRYAAVHVPFRAFLHNLDGAAQAACLRACFAHLAPGGELTLNVFHPSLTFMARNHDALAGVWRWRAEKLLPDGGRVLLSDATTYDTPRQRVSARLRYEVLSAEGELLRTHVTCLELAYLYPGDLRALLAAAGFVDVRIDGGFEGKPFDVDGQELVVRATRPDR